ncbi:aldo/keto reductase [Fervidibacter sacchari]|uniref:Aldo/keto reductase-like oxidoreductase n=1 Tax=Candidatus Fervidibacter sacchari TaxID=1448929 RepID=A0ABT2EPD1_9BACT|nr:aldo/keto reductase [Candidatus Fervidibacter sacchari]MCS3919816.1 putative aldo/keto reductase-like oxidoreductase [Candidatus Fervidibacter sacchari]WKU16944.1 aldo/keto reductase [Candidatus Fervidibacter sacchari]
MLTRREFLKKTVQGLTALAVSESVMTQSSTIPMRTLGKTGLKLPVLGFGGAVLASFWGNPLSYKERVELVRYAYERGVRYFDTAGNYGESQSILGEALKDRRKDVCLVTKVETTKPEEVRKAVEKSLKELQTDYLDILLIHGTPGLEQMSIEQAMKIHAELVKLRDEKITRFIGFSAHGYFDKALALIKTGEFDMCMLAYGYIPFAFRSFLAPQMVKLRDECLTKAHELGMGVVAMKVLSGGLIGRWSSYLVPGFDEKRLEQLPAAAIRYVMQDKRINLLVIGMRSKEEVDANIKVVSADSKFTKEDRALLAEFTRKLYETAIVKKMRRE